MTAIAPPRQADAPQSKRSLDWLRDGADWPLREHSRFIRAAGIRWHVQDLGSGPVVALLHGAGGASHSWRGVAPLLAGHARVIVPDLPGHGFTDQPRRAAMTLPAMAAGIAELLRVMDAPPTLIAGHSAGAAIAAQMALDAETPPRAVVAFNGAFLPFPGLAGRTFPTLAKMLAANPFVPQALAWSADRRAVDSLMEQGGMEIDAEGRRLYRLLLSRPSHVRAALDMLAAWDLRPLARTLPGLPCRLELIFGEDDRAVPPSVAVDIASKVPGAHLVGLPGLGHLAHEQRPDLAAAAILRVLDAGGGKTG
jgi:magnesium chelatase accessory protein